MNRGLMYSLLVVALIVIFGGLGFWLLDPGIETLADGFWLAFTTASTVGYGDVIPLTHASRGFAVVMVLLGLTALSLVTASLSSIFMRKDVHAENHALTQELMGEIRLLREQINNLQSRIQQLQDMQRDEKKFSQP